MVDEIIPSFQNFDTDKSGKIDLNELQDLCAKLGHTLTEEQCNKAMKDLDVNKDEVISLDEF